MFQGSGLGGLRYRGKFQLHEGTNTLFLAVLMSAVLALEA